VTDARPQSPGAEQVPTRVLPVQVPQPYSVHVGADLLPTLPALVPHRTVALISDANVEPLYGAPLATALQSAGRQVVRLSVPAGESSKSLEQYGALLNSLAAAAFPRDGAVVALGGGVVGDLAGFVAASYMRGVALYQVPTSLLAMVDASVGGKTAIDLPAGKNLVGAFWQPRAVFADVSTLRSLPEREFRQGTVELVKHGLLAEPSLLSTFAAGWSQDLPLEHLADAVARSVAVKARVVAADERESGVRAHLNLGHTLAHALEAASQQRLAHGDAVAYGLVYAALLARRRGYADHTAAVYELFNWVLPGPLPVAEFAELYAYMQRDKKVANGQVRFVLLESVGKPVVVDDMSYGELERAYGELLKVVA